MTRFAQSALAALIALCTPLGTSLAVTQAARAADLAVYSDEDSGVCGEAWVLNKITSRFSYQVHHVPNLPDVEITDFQRIHQHRYFPANDTWPIGRRYCGATVSLSDGGARTIWYLIEEGQGFASIGDNVEFCVSGFDRWMVYNGRCRVLR
jgi:capsid protein